MAALKIRRKGLCFALYLMFNVLCRTESMQAEPWFVGQVAYLETELCFASLTLLQDEKGNRLNAWTAYHNVAACQLRRGQALELGTRDMRLKATIAGVHCHSREVCRLEVKGLQRLISDRRKPVTGCLAYAKLHPMDSEQRFELRTRLDQVFRSIKQCEENSSCRDTKMKARMFLNLLWASLGGIELDPELIAQLEGNVQLPEFLAKSKLETELLGDGAYTTEAIAAGLHLVSSPAASCYAWQGSSGGAVADTDGRLIGIIEGPAGFWGATLNRFVPVGRSRFWQYNKTWWRADETF